MVPSNRTDPSAAGRSTIEPSEASAESSASWLVAVLTPTSRSVKNEVIRVIGFSGWLLARSRVPGQSTLSPAALGSSSLRASPAVTATGRFARGSISARSRCSASATGRPPTGTPATSTPRGIEPAPSARSPP